MLRERRNADLDGDLKKDAGSPAGDEASAGSLRLATRRRESRAHRMIRTPSRKVFTRRRAEARRTTTATATD